MWSVVLKNVASKLARMKAFQEGIVVAAVVVCSALFPKMEQAEESLWEMVDHTLEKLEAPHDRQN